MPILVVAGFKAFGRTVSVRVDGVYAQDLLGFDASRLFLDPGRVAIEVHPAEDEISNYLSEVAYIFNHRRPGDLDEKMRAAVDAIVVWRQTVSEGVKRSGRHTDERRLLLRLLAEAVDFPKLILEQFPAALGRRNGGKNVYRSTLRVLEKARNDIDRLVDGYVREAVEVVGEVLSLSPGGDPVQGILRWVECFDVPGLMRRNDLTMTDKAVLRTAMDTRNGRYSAESLARTVSSVLLHRGIERWDDRTGDQLRRVLRECRARIE